MKKVLFVLCLVLFAGVANGVSAETVKIYPTSDGFNQLGDIDGQTNWSLARTFDANSLGNAANNTADHSTVRSDKGSGKYRIYRGSMSFDTSIIPDSAFIKNVTLYLYRENANNSNEIDIVFTKNSRLSPITIQKSDWQLVNYGSELSRGLLKNNSYTAFKFNELHNDYINKIGFTSVGSMTEYDFDNVEPPLIIGTALNASFLTIEAPGTDKDPYLEIEYEVPEENTYPLYTQVVSEYPSVGETTSWADDVYASGKGELGKYPCGRYIKNCGCALTSLVMSARNLGITEDVTGADVNPGNMNAYLDSVGGYDWEGSLYWLAAQAYFGELTGEGEIASRFTAFSGTSEGQDAMAFIDAAFASGNKVVLGFKNEIGHFVWLPEKTDDSYIVRDPWRYSTQTANDDVSSEYVYDYNNTFDRARTLTVSDTPKVLSGGSIEAYVSGAAELLYKNVTGQKVGKDTTGAVVVDIPNAFYGDNEVIAVEETSGSKGKHLLVYESGDEFTIDVVGVGSGSYRVDFFTISESGEIETYTLEGVAIPGVATTFSFDLETSEVTEQPMTYEQFLAILNMQMTGYTEQQKAFFMKWAEKMYSDMTEKTIAQALKTMDAYKKLLVAKKVQSPILSGVIDLLKSKLK